MTKPRKARNATKRAKKEKTQPKEETWVDRIDFYPVKAKEYPQQSTEISIISWNILANSYCSRRSQSNLPAAYQSTVFSPHRRKALICRCLRKLNADVFCLQEVDMDDVGDTLREKGYVGVETPRSQKGGGSTGGRVDSCVVYVRNADWMILEDELVRLDDLAFLLADNCNVPDQISSGNNGNLQGIQQSFLRRNVALLVRIQHRRTKQTVVVANAHLFWHPAFEYVKVCQAHYILTRARKFCKDDEAFLFAGDLNSRPGGATHSYLTQGIINMKHVAPWYNEPGLEKDELVKIVDDMGQLILHSAPRQSTPCAPRYLLDFTLNKLCRWLRIMGIDAELETEEEERLRTTMDKDERRMIVLERCRKERRTLVTTSNRLLQRKDCPSSAYCISPTGLRNLEGALAQMLVTHGVVLEPSKFLSRCVVCNGLIVCVEDAYQAKNILIAYEAPETLINDAEGNSLEVYQCDGCKQPYWWCDIPTSSASRVKTTATRLLKICLRAGVPYTGRLGIFDHVSVEQLNSDGGDFPETNLESRLNVIEWLKCENTACPFRLESAYAKKDSNANVIGELLPFTNVTHDFVDTLDYIFFDAKKMELTHRLYVPQRVNDLNSSSIARGHLLPSSSWPSDHLAVGSRFVLNESFPTQIEQAKTPVPRIANATQQRGKDENSPFDLSTLEFCQPIYSNADDQISLAGSQNGDAQASRAPQLNFCQPFGLTREEPTTPSGVVHPTQPQTNGALVLPTQNVTHDNRCACGCVPKIPSLFEMAELRRQAKVRSMAKTIAII
ncbi:hypothetical protein FisN_5Lh290 [Fistulifera solaris]|uniref:Endonuclease/exonuclease/phosphatase domain-containing protein n=1 Tax=Fistulifera solaris TaxID=1519565 RepID=A0A1Z5KGW3_FISSO|nr:hypothetical protein FisN_5Lh290 [Fistulifera solaris]|eukprot:GAX25208.1 hypothetical protein FisN_5Lh290 [Fistulifera solaris]